MGTSRNLHQLISATGRKALGVSWRLIFSWSASTSWALGGVLQIAVYLTLSIISIPACAPCRVSTDLSSETEIHTETQVLRRHKHRAPMNFTHLYLRTEKRNRTGNFEFRSPRFGIPVRSYLHGDMNWFFSPSFKGVRAVAAPNTNRVTVANFRHPSQVAQHTWTAYSQEGSCLVPVLRTLTKSFPTSIYGGGRALILMARNTVFLPSKVSIQFAKYSENSICVRVQTREVYKTTLCLKLTIERLL